MTALIGLWVASLILLVSPSQRQSAELLRSLMQLYGKLESAPVGIKNDKDIADLWAYLKQFGADGAKK